MTDQELTEIIATKVMGWDLGKSRCTVEQRGEHGYYERPFNPLHNDGDCMMAWDKFSENRETSIQMHRLLTGKRAWRVSVIGEDLIGDLDRRRAMCECMARAVSQ